MHERNPDTIPWKALCANWLAWTVCTAAIMLVAWAWEALGGGAGVR